MPLRSPREYTVALAGNGERLVNVAGQRITVLAATGDFMLSMADGAFSVARQGISYALPADEVYDSISIRDMSGNANTVTFISSWAEVLDARLTVNAPVQIEGTGAAVTTADVTIAAGSTEPVVAANADRRRLVLTNLDTTVTLRIGDASAGAGQGVPLGPGETLQLETAAAIDAYNPGGAGVLVAVLELEN